MTLPLPAVFNPALSSDRLQEVATWLLDELYATEDDLSRSTDNGYTRGCTTFGRQRSRIVAEAASGKHAWLGLPNGNNDVVFTIGGVPCRFSNDDPANPSKDAVLTANRYQTEFLEFASLGEPGRFWFIIDRGQDGASEPRVEFLGFTPSGEVACRWVSDAVRVLRLEGDQPLATKVALRQVARARGEMLKRLIGVLDEHVELPSYQVNEADAETIEAIERATEIFRSLFGLGMGPLSSATRIAENAGAVVMRVSGLAPEIDAISFATKRPLIALNGDGRSACRERFGIAHELGHFSLHIGVLTGDRLTETQANRFASALLLPRSTFATECRLALRGTRLNWAGLSELKMRWGVSKAAIIFRARQLGLFTEEQARAGYVGLNRHGEALRETEDHLIPSEEPEVIVESLKVMREHFGVPEAAVAREMRVQPPLLQTLLGHSGAESPVNVVRLVSSRSTA